MEGEDPNASLAPDTARWVRMRRRLTASPERVFRAWTDPEELARWFPERVEGGLAVGMQSTLVWSHRRVSWDVIEAEPNRTFAFRRSWLSDERLVTTTTLRIDPIGYGSRVDLEDGPFPIDQASGLEAWAEALEGWSEALAMLRAHLDFSVDLREL